MATGTVCASGHAKSAKSVPSDNLCALSSPTPFVAGDSGNDSDEDIVANDPRSVVATSLGTPLPCTFATHTPLTSALSAVVPKQDRSFVGGRLQQFGDRWDSFFGPHGPGRQFKDAEATRLVKHGFLPQLTSNPIQRVRPRERLLEPGPQADATDALVDEYVGKGIIEEISEPPPPPRAPLSSLDTLMVHLPGVPFRVPRTVYPWVHDFFLVPKPHSSKWRGITNAKKYNEFTPKIAFKLPGVAQLRAVVRPQDYMAGFDVQDFFPHIAVHPHVRDHLIFRHRKQAGGSITRWYRYVGLCFGLTDAPRSSMRCLRPVLAFLRSMDARLAMFIDDGLVAAKTEQECVEAMGLVLRILDYLGFILHPVKTKPRPSQRRLFLGSVCDTSNPAYVSLRLPRSKIKGLKRTSAATRAGLRNRNLKLRQLASMLGKARAARDCVTVCYLMTRNMLRWQNEVLSLLLLALGIRSRAQPFFDEELSGGGVGLPDGPVHRGSLHQPEWAKLVNWDVNVFSVLSAAFIQAQLEPLVEELLFWSQELHQWNGKWLAGAPPPHSERPPILFESDASDTGGGLVMDKPIPVEARWHWKPAETPNSINWKELVSVEMGLRAASKKFGAAMHRHLDGGQRQGASDSSCASTSKVQSMLQGQVVSGELDNTSAIAYINRQGGPVPSLSALAERLWKWLLRQQCWIHCKHLAGVLNVRADKASRWRDDRQEWRLSDEAFEKVEDLFGPHTVDLFASRRNTLLPRFFSRWLDPEAAATDALSRSWALEGNPYAHPPIGLIAKVLDKLREDKCELTLVAPVWASQAWITSLIDMSVALPTVLLCQHLFEAPSCCLIDNDSVGWRTAVWRLSGDASRTKVCRSRLRSVLWPA